MSDDSEQIAEQSQAIPNAIRQAFAQAALAPFNDDDVARLASYLELLQRWNARLNLSAIRQSAEIIDRHFVESAFTALHVPIGATTLMDYGSGAGFPGIPIAICRPDLRITLAEAQGKKASFLREAVRVTRTGCEVYDGRVEEMPSGHRFDVVTMRAVEKMEAAIPIAARRVSKALLLLTTQKAESGFRAAAPDLLWNEPIRLPNSREGLLLVGTRA